MQSASRHRQLTMPVPHHSVFYRPDAFPALWHFYIFRCVFQCFEGHPACKKLEWWDAGVVMCDGQGADLHMPSPADATATH